MVLAKSYFSFNVSLKFTKLEVEKSETYFLVQQDIFFQTVYNRVQKILKRNVSSCSEFMSSGHSTMIPRKFVKIKTNPTNALVEQIILFRVMCNIVRSGRQKSSSFFDFSLL